MSSVSRRTSYNWSGRNFYFSGPLFSMVWEKFVRKPLKNNWVIAIHVSRKDLALYFCRPDGRQRLSKNDHGRQQDWPDCQYIVFIVAGCGRPGHVKSEGRGDEGNRKFRKWEIRVKSLCCEFPSAGYAQVSVQRRDAKLGHWAAAKTLCVRVGKRPAQASLARGTPR